jgi:hypothetical protein
MRFVKLWGGLGNQLFQYVFGRHLECVTGDKVCFVSSNCNSDLTDLKINKFNLQLNSCSEESFLYSGYFESNYRFKRKMFQLFPFINSDVLVESKNTKLVDSSNCHILYDGYWQNLQYLEYQSDKIKSLFKLKEIDLFRNSPFINDIISHPNSVSVHLRRGDFLSSGYHQCLSMDYYKTAIDKMSSLVSEPLFFIFTNDLDWAKEEFNSYRDIVFVDHSLLLDSDLYDFYLMTQCKHSIIANSTFSWWAAWLNDFVNKTQIAPERWYRGSSNELAKKILDESWIIV